MAKKKKAHEHEVSIAWTPRHPSLGRDTKVTLVNADNPVQAAYRAFEAINGRELKFDECDYNREEFEEQFDEVDTCICGAFFAELPIGYRGQFTFLVTD